VLLIVEYCAVNSPVFFILVSLSCFLLFSGGVLVPITLFYCRVVVVSCYLYAVLLSCSCNGVSCYLLSCFIVVEFSWSLGLPIIIIIMCCRVVSCRVVLPIYSFFCRCLVMSCYLLSWFIVVSYTVLFLLIDEQE
jgi:hypothetical protein